MDQPATASANEQRQATWAEYFAQLRSLGVADVQRNPVRGDVFHDVTIEGFRFRAAVSAFGPFIDTLQGNLRLESREELRFCGNWI